MGSSGYDQRSPSSVYGTPRFWNTPVDETDRMQCAVNQLKGARASVDKHAV